MPDETSPHALSSVLQSAKRLNQASDAVNATIASIQNRLVEANFGVEYWHYKDPVETSFNDHGEEEHLVLGFYKSESAGWCLATKLCSEGQDEDGSHIRSWRWTPLLKSTRDARVSALGVIPAFLTALDSHIQRVTGQIEATVRAAVSGSEEK